MSMEVTDNCISQSGISYSLADIHIGHQKLATSEHARTSANRRQQMADIDFVKNTKQRAMTLK